MKLPTLINRAKGASFFLKPSTKQHASFQIEIQTTKMIEGPDDLTEEDCQEAFAMCRG